MSKKSDDSIERIFRQALTQYDSTFQESDWLKMEKLLNEEANRRAAARSKRIKGTAYTLTGLTGLIIAVYFLAFRNPSDSIAELNNSVNEMQATGDLEKDGIVKLENPPDGLLSETPPSKSPGVLGGKEKADLSNKTLGEESTRDQTDKNAKKGGVPPGEEGRDNGFENRGNDPQVLTKGNTKSSNEPIDGRSTEPSGANLKAAAVGAAPATGVAGQNGSGGDGTTRAAGEPADSDKTKAAGAGIVSATVPAPINSQTTEQITSNSASLASGEKATKATQVGPDSIISSEEKNALAHRIDSLENTKAQSEEKQKTKPPYRLSIGIILAPEFSTTSLDEYSAPGGSFGLRIGYQVSNRLNIKTGIIRSMKKYEGDGYDYAPRNPLYWNNRTNGVVPEAIDSKCLVYELPVGVQFDAIQTQKSRVFLSAALSSYFMISQAYDYTFESPNPGADMGWRSSGSESYWFSVGMVSAGYERYVHRSFAIGIEPYLKISLDEIGWPNIKLFSGGAYVTLRYRFMKPQK
jgi:hypothetical protein